VAVNHETPEALVAQLELGILVRTAVSQAPSGTRRAAEAFLKTGGSASEASRLLGVTRQAVYKQLRVLRRDQRLQGLVD